MRFPRTGPTGGERPRPPEHASFRHGVEVTAFRLARVDRAETAVRAVLAEAGVAVRDLRVRDLGESVRVEVPETDVPAVSELSRVRDAVAAAGFGEAAVDVGAFWSGRLHGDQSLSCRSGPGPPRPTADRDRPRGGSPRPGAHDWSPPSPVRSPPR